MANLRETSIWEAGIYQLETSDPVMGGENGIDNRAPRQLANRTLWLKNELARQIDLVNQNAADLSNQKADKSVQFTAGNGLIGGGDFSTSRTLALGTPSKITATTTNTAVSNTHSHEIDKASTATAGIVQLADTLTSSATNLALTAHQGKVLKGQIDSKLASNANAVSATKLHTAHTINGVAFDGSADITVGLPTFGTTINQAQTLLNNANDAISQGGFTVRHLSSTTTNKPDGISHAMMSCVYDGKYASQIATDWRTNKLYSRTLNNGQWTTWKEVAYTDGNVASATKLHTPRNIAMTGDGSWNVNFDGTNNVSATLTLANTGVRAGSYNSVTVDAKGRVIAGLTQTHGLITATSTTGTTNTATNNANTFLNIVATGVGSASAVGSSTQITGTHGITVSSDTAGKLIISQAFANNLTDTSTTKALTANMGKVLKDELTALDGRKFDKTGGVLTGTLYVPNTGIKGAQDNDTGIEFPRDGVFRTIVDNKERLHIQAGGNITLRTHDGASLAFQNDKNLVLYDTNNHVIWSSNTMLRDIAGKVNKSGDTMTGHLAVTYNSDWVGMSVRNPNNQKNGFYDVNIDGVTRGSFQITHAGNNAYNANINITTSGDNTERRVAGLVVSESGLYAHAYGHLHEYFVKVRDNQTIGGVKTFSSSPNAPTPPANSNDTTVATTAFVVREVDNLIGQVAFFAMNAAPTGWLKANGAAVSRTTYTKLFAKIGTTFGAGDGRTTFNLPDLRGEFVRGFDDGRRVDNGRTFGTAQKGTLVAPKDDAGAENVFAFSSSQEVYGDKNLSDYGQLQMFYSSSAVSTPSALAISMTAQIARPRNIALLACIKF